MCSCRPPCWRTCPQVTPCCSHRCRQEPDYCGAAITSSLPSSVFPAERQQALGALERLQAKLAQREEWAHSASVGTLRQTLQSPLFTHVLTLQQSIRQLRNQVIPQHVLALARAAVASSRPLWNPSSERSRAGSPPGLRHATAPRFHLYAARSPVELDYKQAKLR